MEASHRAAHANEQVGVRELRQNLSVYLRRIAGGEEFTVTERGRPVARLTALPKPTSLIDRLIAEGRLIPPAKPGPIGAANLPPLVRLPEGALSSQQILDELREDRI